MAKFEVLSSHGLGGGKFCDVGDVIEITDEKEAAYRLRIGLVKPLAPAKLAAIEAEEKAAAEAAAARAAAEQKAAEEEAARIAAEQKAAEEAEAARIAAEQKAADEAAKKAAEKAKTK